MENACEILNRPWEVLIDEFAVFTVGCCVVDFGAGGDLVPTCEVFGVAESGGCLEVSQG